MLRLLSQFRRFAAKVVPTPYMADSITQGTLSSWERQVGDLVKQDELVANIETDKVSVFSCNQKVTIPVNSPETGVILELMAKEGDTVEVGSDLFKIDTDSSKTKFAVETKKQPESDSKQASRSAGEEQARAAEKREASASASTQQPPVAKQQPTVSGKHSQEGNGPEQRAEHREKMTRMRLRIAERMKEAQNTAASLTTFNEVDMSSIISIRNKHKDAFFKEHGVKLGYMSMFMKACSMALQEIPIVNSRIDPESSEIIVPDYVDISVAVATPKARDNKLAVEELTGGTFTISNGGVFGSLLGTPILNMPQVAILGMHAIKERPVVVDGAVVVRPMMFLALSYDHRVIDGREAATFLVRVKELLEDPLKFLLDL